MTIPSKEILETLPNFCKTPKVLFEATLFEEGTSFFVTEYDSTGMDEDIECASLPEAIHRLNLARSTYEAENGASFSNDRCEPVLMHPNKDFIQWIEDEDRWG